MMIGVCVAGITTAAVPHVLSAQAADARLRNNKEELERIRREREALQQKMDNLKSSAHDLTDEVRNIDRQHDATRQAVKSLDDQLGLIGDAVVETSTNLVKAEDEATAKRAILRRRLIDIYKRGPAVRLRSDALGPVIR